MIVDVLTYEKIPGIASVHELHVWRLNQKKSIASAHIVMSDASMKDFVDKAKIATECFHAYGIHSATLQPEFVTTMPIVTSKTQQMHGDDAERVKSSAFHLSPCQFSCGNLCESLTCCG